MTPTSIVAYLSLFAGTGFIFLFATLLLGRLLRARVPTRTKRDTYECGEPSVGSSYVQFDLRFYVVALIFLVFDVEVAFFFPWASAFGKAVQVAGLTEVASASPSEASVVHQAVQQRYGELGMPASEAARSSSNLAEVKSAASQLSLASMIDLGVFFAVLMLGFAYVWSQGDLDWVRAVGRRSEAESSGPAATSSPSLAG